MNPLIKLFSILIVSFFMGLTPPTIFYLISYVNPPSRMTLSIMDIWSKSGFRNLCWFVPFWITRRFDGKLGCDRLFVYFNFNLWNFWGSPKFAFSYYQFKRNINSKKVKGKLTEGTSCSMK